MFVLLGRLDELTVASDSEVISRDDYARFVEASEIVQRATVRAAEIETEARERGYGEGLEQARRAACVQVGTLHAEAMRTWSALREQLVTLVMGIVEGILQPADRGWLYRAALDASLMALRQASPIVLRVHSGDRVDALRFLEASGDEFAPGVRVVADASLPAGACTADTPWGTVHVSLPMVLEAIRAALHDAIGDANLIPTPVADSGNDLHNDVHDDQGDT